MALEDAACCAPCKEQPKKYITYAWFSSMALSLCSFATACVVADRHRGKGIAALGFAAVWTAILTLAVAVAGTTVLRLRQTPFALGGLVGGVAVLANQCLILVAVFGAEARRDSNRQRESDNAFAAIMFFLFLAYLLFAALLGTFRNHIIKTRTRPAQAKKKKHPSGDKGKRRSSNNSSSTKDDDDDPDSPKGWAEAVERPPENTVVEIHVRPDNEDGDDF